MSRGFELKVGESRFLVLTLPETHGEGRVSLATLTPAEREVAEGVLAGRSNADIARVRGVSSRTIAKQVTAIFRKLGVRSRMELIARCS